MNRRVALVVSATADDPAWLVGARLRHLLDRGWDARLLAKGEPWAQAPEVTDPDLRERVQLAPAGEAAAFDRSLRALEPDLVHFHSGWAAWKETSGAQPRDFAVVIGLREDGQDLRVPDLERLWRSAGLLLFGARSSLERAAAQGCPVERCAVLPPPARSPGTAALAGDGASAGVLRMLSVGPLTWEHGLEHSIQAVRLLADMGVPCEYRIVGEGSHVGAVAFARHQLGVQGQVELLGPDGHDGLEEQVRWADVYVDPAVTDTTPATGLDTALLHGVPFVATARDRALPDGGGLTVARRAPREMAEALARLANDPALRAQMGDEALRSEGRWVLADHLAEYERLLATAVEP